MVIGAVLWDKYKKTAAFCRSLHFSKTFWISSWFWITSFRLKTEFPLMTNEKKHFCFPEDNEQAGRGHQDQSPSCTDDVGVPHWITVDSASTSSTNPLPSTQAFSPSLSSSYISRALSSNFRWVFSKVESFSYFTLIHLNWGKKLCVKITISFCNYLAFFYWNKCFL